MFRNNLRLVLRGLRKDIGFSAINLIGLAIGLASCLLILLFVTHELSFDKGYEQSDNIYRVVIDAEIGGSESEFAIAPYAAYPAFRDDLASVINGTRVEGWGGQVVVDGVNFEEEDGMLADTSFFEVFSADYISGEPETVLDQPGSVVLSETTADRLFGSIDVVGRTLTMNDMEMTVTGVTRTPETASHLTWDFVVSVMNLPQQARDGRDGAWYNIGMWTYVVLPDDVSVADFEQQMAEVHENRAGAVGRQIGILFSFKLQKLTDIHLHSARQAEFGANGNVNYVYAFGIIAVFILLIACVNFANLSTARSTMRAKEVGVRKAIGAGQPELVRRFLTESFVTVLIASGLALVFTAAAMGWFNQITGKDLTMMSLATPTMLAGALVLILICSLAAGGYPAFVLSAFKPVTVLRGQVAGLASKSATRRGLVVMQFGISIVLIIGTFVIWQQIEYMKNKPLGFDKEAVAVINMDTENDRATWESFRQQLLSNSAIARASFSSGVPGNTGELRLFVPQGRDSSETFATTVARVDHDYVDTYGMEMASGRFFSRQFPSDSSEAFVINQAAARSFGWSDEEAIGKDLEWRGFQDSQVIGVVEDYHYRALTEEIAPLVFWLSRQPFGQLTVRFAQGSEIAGVDHVRAEWAAYETQRPLDLRFVDEDLESRYGAQETAGNLISIFAILAIFIAALGLFGLASFAVQRRTKEIGVRKVMGATAQQVVLLVTNEFTTLLLIANVIAWPLGWYLISNFWLSQFPYRMDLTIVPFVIAGVLSLVVTLAATLYHSISAAHANPVESLRYE